MQNCVSTHIKAPLTRDIYTRTVYTESAVYRREVLQLKVLIMLGKKSTINGVEFKWKIKGDYGFKYKSLKLIE